MDGYWENSALYKRNRKRKTSVKFQSNSMPNFDLQVTNRHLSGRIVRTSQKNQIYEHLNKKDEEKVADVQKINYY